MAEEAGGRRRPRSSHERHDDLRHAEAEGTLDDDRPSASLHGVLGEVVAIAVEAAHTEKEGAGRHLPVVIGEVHDLDRGRVVEQVTQLGGAAQRAITVRLTEGILRRHLQSAPIRSQRRSCAGFVVPDRDWLGFGARAAISYGGTYRLTPAPSSLNAFKTCRGAQGTRAGRRAP